MVRLTEKGQTLPTLRAKKQQALLSQLYEGGAIKLSELKALGFASQTIKALEAKALIVQSIEHDSDWAQNELHLGDKPRLNDQQATICSAINAQVGYRTFLIEGVTGSGKTEVYLQKS